ncbi:prenyltransferase/squalene oxidase repeat-containing protein [Streptomyces sp. NPDC002537]
MAPSFAVHARRGAAALATAAVLSAAVAPAAVADGSPSPAAPGLFGTSDPKFDGVFRQSLALLAQHTAGVAPAKQAVDWLTGQQCADGGFTAYRADAGTAGNAGKACDAKTPLDSNATAVAVQALAALGGHGAEVTKAVGWLKATQNEDGGWSYNPGGPSDANSTSIVIGALAAAGEDAAKVTSKKGRSGYDGLVALQLGCDAAEADRGAFAYQPDKSGKLAANAAATAAAALAGLGKGYAVEPVGKDAKDAKDSTDVKPLSCKGDEAGTSDPKAAAGAAAAYLAQVMDKEQDGPHLAAVQPGADKPAPDFGNTAGTVIALAAGGHRDAAAKPLKWLEQNSAAWAKTAGPAAYAQLVLAAHAAGANPRDFGGADLVAQLTATGPKADAAASPSGSEEPKKEKEKEKKDGGSGFGTWWIVGVFFVASVGAGFLISGRKKKNQL